METPTPDGETVNERVARELSELLDELRILLTGVLLVFAFLLAAPFSNAFDQVTDVEKIAYVVAFACSALAAVMVIAPVVHHRARFRQGDKEALLRRANAQCLIAITMLGGALTSASYLVFSFVVAPWAGAVAALGVGSTALWLWGGRVAARPTLAERTASSAKGREVRADGGV